MSMTDVLLKKKGGDLYQRCRHREEGHERMEPEMEVMYLRAQSAQAAAPKHQTGRLVDNRNLFLSSGVWKSKVRWPQGQVRAFFQTSASL